MSNTFTDLAFNATSLSRLMEGREKISVDDVIEQFPDGVTVTDFDIVTAGLSTYPVVTFAELPDNYMNGGTILASITEAWAGAFDGDIDAASKALHATGGVKMHFVKTRTKAGNNLTVPVIHK